MYDIQGARTIKEGLEELKLVIFLVKSVFSFIQKLCSLPLQFSKLDKRNICGRLEHFQRGENHLVLMSCC